MKITKYPQSCFTLETNSKKVLVDPGSINFKDEFLEDWKDTDIILVTHKHGDHCHVPAILKLMENQDVKFFTTQEVSEFYPELKPTIVKQGETIVEDDLKIEVVKAVHGYIPKLKGEKEVHENIGYIINAEGKRIYTTSDTICFKNDYKCDLLFVPVNNHGLTMGPFEAALFAKETGAKLVIPYHCDHPVFTADLDWVKKIFDKEKINYKYLICREKIEF